MTRPTPEQIEETRAALSKRLAKATVPERVGKLALLPFKDARAGIEISVLAVPFTFAGWCAHTDARMVDRETAQNNVVVERCGFPENLLELCRKWPALVVKIDDEIHKRARPAGVPTRKPLDMEALPSGLSVDAAQRLTSAAQRDLWTLVVGDFAAVLEQPDADVYQATRARMREAQAEGKGYADSFSQPVCDAVKWSSTPLDEQLDKTPALLTLLLETWSAAGGADVECKSELV